MGKSKRKISAKDRREALRKRTRENARDRNDGSISQALDLSSLDDIELFKPGKKNRIDIIPYLITTENHPQKVGIGYEDYVLSFWIHREVGAEETSCVCLAKTFGEKCPICEEAKRLRIGGGADKDVLKALKPSQRCLYNVIDLDNEEEGIQLFNTSHYLFEKELLEEAENVEDEEVVVFADLEDGKTVTFRSKKDSTGDFEFSRYKGFDFKDRKEGYDESILDDSISLDALLKHPTYDAISALFYGDDAPEESESEEAPDKKKTGKKVGKKVIRKKEPEPEEEEAESEEEETESEEEETETESEEEEVPEPEEEEVPEPEKKKTGKKTGKKAAKKKPEPEEEEPGDDDWEESWDD